MQRGIKRFWHSFLFVLFSFLFFYLFLLCLGENARKHNDKSVYDQHNQNHEKNIIIMLVIMDVSFKVTPNLRGVAFCRFFFLFFGQIKVIKLH